jgi:hypothetical protein
MDLRGANFAGNLFYGSKSYMVLEDRGSWTFMGDKRYPGATMRMVEKKQDENTAHLTNFLTRVRARRSQPVADAPPIPQSLRCKLMRDVPRGTHETT